MSSDPAVASGLRKTYMPRGNGRNRAAEATYLHRIARRYRWKLGKIQEGSIYSRSYGWVRVETDTGSISILLETGGRVCALSEIKHEPPVDLSDFRFLDRPEFVQAVADFWWPIQVLSVAELKQPLSETDREFLRRLDSRFAYDLDHWRPETVGQVIFNWWD